MQLLYSYNFVDMSLSDDPIRSTVSTKFMGRLKAQTDYSLEGVLGLHEVDLNDEMINPLPTSGTVSYYANFKELDNTSYDIPDNFDR